MTAFTSSLIKMMNEKLDKVRRKTAALIDDEQDFGEKIYNPQNAADIRPVKIQRFGKL